MNTRSKSAARALLATLAQAEAEEQGIAVAPHTPTSHPNPLIQREEREDANPLGTDPNHRRILARIALLRSQLVSAAETDTLDQKEEESNRALRSRLMLQIHSLQESLKFLTSGTIPADHSDVAGDQEHESDEEESLTHTRGRRVPALRIDSTIPQLDPKAVSVPHIVQAIESYALARAYTPDMYGNLLLASVNWDPPTARIVLPWIAEVPSLSWAEITKRLEATFSPVTYLETKKLTFIRTVQKKGESIQQFTARFMRTAEELSYLDANPLLIDLFKANILSPYRRCLLQSSEYGGASAQEAALSLSKTCAAAIRSSAFLTREEVEQVGLPEARSGSSTTTSSYTPSSRSSGKPTSESPADPICPLHGGHTTSACRVLRKQRNTATSNASPADVEGKAPSLSSLQTGPIRAGPTPKASRPKCTFAGCKNPTGHEEAKCWHKFPHLKPAHLKAATVTLPRQLTDIADGGPPLPQDPLLVPVTINHSARILSFYDPGASNTFISRKLAEQLQLQLIPIGELVTVEGFHKGDVSAIEHYTSPVTLRTTSAHTSAPLLVLSDSRYELILGRDVLSHLHLLPILPIDFPSELDSGEVKRKLSEEQLRTPLDPSSLSTSMVNDVAVADEQQVAALREALAAPLAANAAISGFCNRPDAVYHVRLTDDTPIYLRQYPLPNAVMPAVLAQREKWKLAGRCRPARPGSTWNLPITTAPKPEEPPKPPGIRVCADTRALNARLIKDAFPIPSIQEILDGLQGCQLFSEFDLSDAYLQLPVAEDSVDKLTFTIAGEQLSFTGAIYGLSDLASVLNRVVAAVFRGMPFVRPFFDNVIIASGPSWEEHTQHCLAALAALNAANLRVAPHKTRLGRRQLRILGHLISAHGVALDPFKASEIADYPFPETAKQLASFIGVAGFLRKHIRNFADLTARMDAAKQNDSSFASIMASHRAELETNFAILKQAIASAPTLRFPDLNRPFRIATDASNCGVGGVLFQPQGTETVPTPDNIVSFTSRALHKYEFGYNPYRKELLGVLHCLRKFRQYLLGHTTIVATDHRALIALLHPNGQLSPTLLGWWDEITGYDLEIEHVPGYSNIFPDALSRLYPKIWGVSQTNTDNLNVPSLSSAVPLTTAYSLHLGAATASPSPSSLAISISGGESSSSSSSSTSSSSSSSSSTSTSSSLTSSTSSSSPATASHQDLSIAAREEIQRLLHKEVLTHLSHEECLTLVRDAHELSGHRGIQATLKLIYHTQGLWWPQLGSDVSSVVSDCEPCQRFTVTKRGFHAARQSSSAFPMDHVEMDLITGLPTSEGFTVLLVVLDSFTGFCFVKPLPSKSAVCVGRALFELFSLIGSPKTLQSDQGSEFNNRIVAAMADQFEMKISLSSSHHSSSQGQVERVIQTLTNSIRKLLHGCDTDWPKMSQLAMMGYNSSFSSTRGAAPFSLFFNRVANQFHAQQADSGFPLELSEAARQEWLQTQHVLLHKIFPLIRERVHSKRREQNDVLNSSHRVVPDDSVKPGDFVMIRDKDRKRKLDPVFVGPFSVVSQTPTGSFIVKNSLGELRASSVPAEDLKPIPSRNSSLSSDSIPTRIQSILDHRGSSPYEYLVRWHKQGPDQDSWVAAADFEDTATIQQYWRLRGEAQSSSLPTARRSQRIRNKLRDR